MSYRIQLALAILFVSYQAKGEGETDAEVSAAKRSVSALARLGMLPYQQVGKRYVAALARNGELGPAAWARPAWAKKFPHPSLEELEDRLEEEDDEEAYNKRYIGALAKTGDLRREEKRDDVESLIDELVTGEELRRLRLEALREELYREREFGVEEPGPMEPLDKRSMASLARAGNLPGKRNLASLVRAGYLKSSPVLRDYSQEERNYPEDDVTEEEKRGDDLERLMNEVYGIDDKRNVQSLARNYNFPSGEKKNVGSFMRSGGLGKRDDDKRNLAALAKNGELRGGGKRGEWGGEEKRYVATLLRQGRLPIGLEANDEERGLVKEGGEKENGEREGGARVKKEVAAPPRNKRETFIPLPSASDEYILPVLERAAYVEDSDQYSPINKRYFAVRGGGKIPGGRLPQIGRTRSRHMNSGRRRH